MSRRERLEAKLEKRREWAAGREEKSVQSFDKVRQLADQIPLGQPILVGHHSESHARRDVATIHRGMRNGVDHGRMAEHHSERARGIERQLATSIFSDDADAIEALEAKISKLETERDRMKRINAAWRKAGKPNIGDRESWQVFVEGAELAQNEELKIARSQQLECYHPQPFPPYKLTNMGGTIRTAKKRIVEVRRQHEASARAEDAGGVSIVRHEEHNWCTVTFAEKPEREILTILKRAGFGWGGGSWRGYLSSLPSEVVELAEAGRRTA